MVRVNIRLSINGPSSSQNAPCPRRKVGEDSLAMALRWPLARFSTGAEPPPPGGFVPRRYPSAQYRNARGFQATGTLCTSTRNSEEDPATADA